MLNEKEEDNMFKSKKVIIFDMDGTLIEPIGIWNKNRVFTLFFLCA